MDPQNPTPYLPPTGHLGEYKVDPNPETYDVVPFYNFTDEDFVASDGAMYNSHPYEVKAGQVKYYPGFIAYHLTKHLIDKILIKSNPNALASDIERKKLADKILVKSAENLPKKEHLKHVKEKVDETTVKEVFRKPASMPRRVQADLSDVEHTSTRDSVDIRQLK